MIGATVGETAVPKEEEAEVSSALAGRPPPISPVERLARIERAQLLMQQQGLSALLIEPGASMAYFTGMHRRRSERPTCAIIPVDGEIGIVTPYFEEASVREALSVPADIRTWLEHEDALWVVAEWLRDRGLGSGMVGVDDTARYFIIEGLMRNLPLATVSNGGSVIRGCRSIKSPAEIALMQHATNITIAAYRQTIPQIAAGMLPQDITMMMKRAHEALGGVPVFEDALIGEAAAYPHGSSQPQIVRPGEILLLDCGCSVEGYQSDISRTFVFGAPTDHQREVWDQVKAGQRIAFEAAQIGTAGGDVDRSVRGYYESIGYGPEYGLPGLSHRTGHGIGLDGHEPFYLVKGETTKLAPGMCFSNEPGIYIPGQFGVRIEDCFYMTDGGPKWFSTPSESIESPV